MSCLFVCLFCCQTNLQVRPSVRPERLMINFPRLHFNRSLFYFLHLTSLTLAAIFNRKRSKRLISTTEARQCLNIKGYKDQMKWLICKFYGSFFALKSLSRLYYFLLILKCLKFLFALIDIRSNCARLNIKMPNFYSSAGTPVHKLICMPDRSV